MRDYAVHNNYSTIKNMTLFKKRILVLQREYSYGMLILAHIEIRGAWVVETKCTLHGRLWIYVRWSRS